MKRVLSLLLSFAFILAFITPALAATPEAIDAANTLYEYGLFKGTGTDTDGRPSFDLDRTLTRNESVSLLVRLLGKESEAQQGSWSIPFTDVATWARPYIGYAYAHKLASGTSATTFNGDAPASVSQYLTIVLRALGYTSGTDFQWDRAWELSDKIGLTDGRYNASTSNFTRGDAAIISKNALDVYVVGSGVKLGETLGIYASNTGTNVPPAAKTGLDKLIDFIVTDSDIKVDGMDLVSYTLPTDDIDGMEKIELRLLYNPNNPKRLANEVLPGETISFSSIICLTSGFEISVTFIYDIVSKQALSNGIIVSERDSDLEIDLFSATSFSFDIASYTNTTNLWFDKAYFESNYSFVIHEDCVGLCNTSVQAAMKSWELFLNRMVGISLRDIGFISYSL